MIRRTFLKLLAFLPALARDRSGDTVAKISGDNSEIFGVPLLKPIVYTDKIKWENVQQYDRNATWRFCYESMLVLWRSEKFGLSVDSLDGVLGFLEANYGGPAVPNERIPSLGTLPNGVSYEINEYDSLGPHKLGVTIYVHSGREELAK